MLFSCAWILADYKALFIRKKRVNVPYTITSFGVVGLGLRRLSAATWKFQAFHNFEASVLFLHNGAV